MKHLPIIVAIGFMSYSAADAGTTAGGTVKINMTGVFTTPVTPLATLNCTGFVNLVPNNLGAAISSLSLGSVLSSLGYETSSAQGVIKTGGTTFTCTAVVNYRWENFDPTAVHMAIGYTVTAKDPGGSNPGQKKQLIETIAIPAAGTVTTLSVTPRL